MALIRLVASVGAGGVLYLTPLVFHHAAFSAQAVTLGIGMAALAGTVGRLVSGLLLDRGLNCSLPVLLASVAAASGDSLLLKAHHFGGYGIGQVLLGIAAGLYWPAIELAVPLSCSMGAHPIPSARGYALVRSADAAGIAAGALIGALMAALGHLRAIYAVDISCVALVVVLLVLRPLPMAPERSANPHNPPARQWIAPLLPVLGITLLATALPALMQSALPLDLVHGSLERPRMDESHGALLIGLQLSLLVVIQWPVGQTLAKKPVAIGLGTSLVAFAAGTLLLALSAFSRHGVALVLLAQLPLALGEAAFLPIATEAVIELTPKEHQGLAMALFSQCFALSALGAPLVAGWALDGLGNGVLLWSGTTVLCLAGLGLLRQLKPRPEAA